MKIVWLLVYSLVFAACTASPGVESMPASELEAILDRVSTMPLDTQSITGECIPAPVERGEYRAYLSLNRIRRLDAYGVAMQGYGTGYEGAGWQYSPLTVADLGQAALNAWCVSEDVVGLKLALIQARWIIDNAVRKDDIVTWHYHFPNSSFLSPEDWSSALANGMIIAFLTRLYALTNDNVYLDTARLAVNSFDRSVEEGGVRAVMDDGSSIFFEEVAHPDAPPGHILNGHILGVRGLAYFADYTGDSVALRLVDEGINGVRNYLPVFDVSTIASYSLGPVPYPSARTHYAHDIHISGLLWMYTRTQDPVFLEYAFRWQNYKRPALQADLYWNTISDETRLPIAPDNSRYFGIESETETGDVILDLHQTFPIHSFGYNSIGIYPTDYTISLSQDAETWEEVVTVSGQDQPHASHVMGGRPARFVRFSLEQLDVLPFGEDMERFLWPGSLFFGPMRVDAADYWETPILIASDGSVAQPNDGLRLMDGNNRTQATLEQGLNHVIYGDLRQPGQPSRLHLENSLPIGNERWIPLSQLRTVADAVIAPLVVVAPIGFTFARRAGAKRIRWLLLIITLLALLGLLAVVRLRTALWSTYQVRLEISNDLQTWTSLPGSEVPAASVLPGTIELPATEISWRYFRLEIIGPALEIDTLSVE